VPLGVRQRTGAGRVAFVLAKDYTPIHHPSLYEETMPMLRRLIIAAFATATFLSVAAPQQSKACPLYACRYDHGHIICPPPCH